jgi:hypothetical protein
VGTGGQSCSRRVRREQDGLRWSEISSADVRAASECMELSASHAACADVGALLAEAVQVDGQEATASRYSCILIVGIIVAATVKTEEEEELSRVGRGSLASEAGSIRTAKSTLAPHECTK